MLSDEDYGDLSPRSLLNLLEDTLNEILPDSSIFQQSHSVTIEYEEDFGIDIIPAFEINENMYKIPHVAEDSESWLDSNPRIHKETLTKANKELKGRLVPIIKLLKSWKRDKCEDIKSFHLELLAIRLFSDTSIESYAEGTQCFFNRAGELFLRACLTDPANDGNLIDDYMTDDERRLVIELIEKEKEVANRAIELEKAGNIDAAISEWDRIFSFNPSRKAFIAAIPAHERELPFPDEIAYSIRITCKLFNPAKKVYRELYYSKGRKLPKNWKLRFYVDADHISNPKEIYWQVVNTGLEAELAHDLRGEIMKDEGQARRDEHTKYRGGHYINCFVVSNGKCIAKDRFFVNIG